MTQTIVHVPASEGGGSFDPTDIEITDNTSGAFLIKEGSNEYMRIDTTDGTEMWRLTLPTASNHQVTGKRLSATSQYLQLRGGAYMQVYMNQSGGSYEVQVAGTTVKDLLYSPGFAGKKQIMSNTGSVLIQEVDTDTNFTHTLDPSNSAVFKVQDNAGTPHEYFNVDTTSGSEQIVLKGRPSSGNAKLVMSDQPFIQGADQQNIQMTSGGIFANVGNVSGKRFQIRAAGTSQYFEVQRTGNVPGLRQDADSAFTYTLDDASGAAFKIVDDDSSPRTYFTATEDGVVEVDGVKVGLGGGRVNDNVAVGKDAFAATQTGFGNSVAVGFEAGKAQVGGYNNTFLGFKAGFVTVNSINNTAVGFAVMEGTNGSNVLTGADNTGVGSSACRNITSGAENVGIGRDALNLCTTGANNVAVGMAAGDAIVGGSGNIAIGHDSDCAAGGTNQIAIGNGVVESTNNRASIGDSSVTYRLDFSGTGNSWSATSDARIKENIQDSDLGLAFINSLRPVKHTSKDPAQWPEEIRPADPSDRTPEQLATVKDGLIAQEVKASADALGTSFSGWEQDANGLNRLQYERFVVPLIKAVQELSAQVEELKGDK